MDRAALKKLLEPFIERCAAKGKPLDEIHLKEAYPGDDSTSYIIEVRASWYAELSCAEVLDILFGFLWETTDVETRRNIFCIKVLEVGHANILTEVNSIMESL
jgi:hypothetical protein